MGPGFRRDDVTALFSPRGEGVHCRCRDIELMLQSSWTDSEKTRDGGNLMMLHRVLEVRRGGASLLTMLALAAPHDARADEPLKAKISVLRLSASAPVFLSPKKGYFFEGRIDIALEIFRCAPAN